MPVRKFGGAWGVRRQVSRLCGGKAEAIRLDRLLASAVAEAERKYRDRAAGCVSIGDGLAAFLSDSRAGLGRRPRGMRTLARHRRLLLAFDKAFQHKPLDAVEPERLARWIKRRQAEGLSPDSIEVYRDSLRAYARWAMDKGLAPARLPVLDVPRVHAPGKLAGKNRRPPPTREMGELKRLLAKIKAEREDIGLFLLGMALFGRRPEAVALWRRRHAAPPRGKTTGRLWTKGLKGGLDREIALPPGSPRAAWVGECLGLGRRLGRDRPGDPLVPCFGARSRRCPGGWTTASFCMALGRLTPRLKTRFTAYQVRHSCVSWLQTRHDIALANTQGFADHARVTTQEAYSHRHNRDAEAAYRRMEEEWGGLIFGVSGESGQPPPDSPET